MFDIPFCSSFQFRIKMTNQFCLDSVLDMGGENQRQQEFGERLIV